MKYLSIFKVALRIFISGFIIKCNGGRIMEKIEVLDFIIKELGNRKRKVRVILPNDYYQNISSKYPVIYMHDGQNLVDPSSVSGYSWDVAKSITKLVDKKVIKGVIIVGIDSDDTYRIPEYTNAISKKAEKGIKKFTKGTLFLPEAHLYGKFIVEVLKPYIDSNYRTLPERENTAIAGSSCGGNVSLYLGTVYNEIFGIIGAFSPAYWIVKEDLFNRVKNKNYLDNTKIYHDMGGKENRLLSIFTCVKDAKKFNQILSKKITNSSNRFFVLDKKATHTELFWQDRFPQFVSWAFEVNNL